MEQCEQHGDLMRIVGGLEGTLQSIQANQSKMSADIGRLFKRIDEICEAQNREIKAVKEKHAEEMQTMKDSKSRFYVKVIGFVALLSSAVSGFIATYIKTP